MLNSLPKTVPTTLALLALSSAPLLATDDSALLKVLVRKGVLTEKEAVNIEAESEKEAAAANAASSMRKLKLADSVTEMKLYGDVKMRYRYDNRDYQVDPLANSPDDRSPNSNQRSRWQFRLRLNADFKLGTDWF